MPVAALRVGSQAQSHRFRLALPNVWVEAVEYGRRRPAGGVARDLLREVEIPTVLGGVATDMGVPPAEGSSCPHKFLKLHVDERQAQGAVAGGDGVVTSMRGTGARGSSSEVGGSSSEVPFFEGFQTLMGGKPDAEQNTSASNASSGLGGGDLATLNPFVGSKPQVPSSPESHAVGAGGAAGLGYPVRSAPSPISSNGTAKRCIKQHQHTLKCSFQALTTPLRGGSGLPLPAAAAAAP